MADQLAVIIDFDGTLTAEEQQAATLAEKSLRTLADEIIGAPLAQLAADYEATRKRLLASPHRYQWTVNGLAVSYCDEGAFILNTTTLQEMLRAQPAYAAAVAARFAGGEYDAVAECTNYLFHRHTAEIAPVFRPAARRVLRALIDHPQRTPVILTNSRGDKVRRHLKALRLGKRLQHVAVLGDTRQYALDATWSQRFPSAEWGEIQIWPVDDVHRIDLRRPAYHQALLQAEAGSGGVTARGSQLAVVADTLSLPGALPLMMGIPFFLLHTDYTPEWCAAAVRRHPVGRVLENLADLPDALDKL